MRDEQLLEAIERYLNGEMNADERREFEQLRMENAEVDQRVNEHQQFVGVLKQYGERVELEKRLNAIHQEIDVHAIEEEVAIRPSWIVTLWREHHSKISVAASIAIFAVLATLFVTGKMDNNSSYKELKGEVDRLGNKTNTLSKTVNDLKNVNRVFPQEQSRGTGFAITSNGLIATAYHVVEKADSVFVQNAAGRVYKTKVLYMDRKNDVAILKISDTTFTGLGAIPYTFKKASSDLAENVFTLGYPQDQPEYGAGSVTALNGLNSDSIDYQVSIPVNAGASGAPLLDSRGDVIGIVKAKETHMEGVHFALKSNYLLAAVDSLSADTSVSTPVLNTKNTLTGLSRQQQVKKLQKYVFMVKVY
ncbi:MAG TPA: serine protease [Mucilaginibacter sp.]|jgi:S1-C subfamily serine protease|nr:serine protease [Mucilaginibacter sp.]